TTRSSGPDAEGDARRSRELSALVTSTGRVLAASPRGWLRRRIVPPAEGASMTLPSGLELTAEPIGASGAKILAPSRGRRVRRRPRLRVEVLGRRRALVSFAGERAELTPRHSEIVVLLALHPDGLSSHGLGRAAYRP